MITKNKKNACTKMIFEKFLKYTKTAKKGRIVSIVAEKTPMDGYLLSLWEYNQIQKILSKFQKLSMIAMEDQYLIKSMGSFS